MLEPLEIWLGSMSQDLTCSYSSSNSIYLVFCSLCLWFGSVSESVSWLDLRALISGLWLKANSFLFPHLPVSTVSCLKWHRSLLWSNFFLCACLRSWCFAFSMLSSAFFLSLFAASALGSLLFYSVVGNSEQQQCCPLLIDLQLLEPGWFVLIATGQQRYRIQSCLDLSID